jgi:hypothetical protein
VMSIEHSNLKHIIFETLLIYREDS